MKFTKFVQLLKVDVAKREVSGVIASEAPDFDKEIFDYESSKPFLKKWSGDLFMLTGGLSRGNVREMHKPSAVGKVTALEFDDANKQVRAVAKVVDDQAWRKVQEGVYTGFSIGGDYAKMWADGDLTRYTADVHEVSLVDQPCNPEATFELVRADGTGELRKFAKEAKTKSVGGEQHPASDFAYVGDPEDPETWKYPVFNKSHAQNALARWGQEKGIPESEKPKVFARIKAAAKAHGVEVSEKVLKLAKSLYGAGGMVQAGEALDLLRDAADGDEAERFRLAEVGLAKVLKELLADEADELLARAGETTTNPKDEVVKMKVKALAKLRETIANYQSEYDKEYEMFKAATHDDVKQKHHEKMEDLHSKLADCHGQMADHYKGDPHDDGDGDEDAAKGISAGDLQKAVEAATKKAKDEAGAEFAADLAKLFAAGIAGPNLNPGNTDDADKASLAKRKAAADADEKLIRKVQKARASVNYEERGALNARLAEVADAEAELAKAFVDAVNESMKHPRPIRGIEEAGLVLPGSAARL